MSAHPEFSLVVAQGGGDIAPLTVFYNGLINHIASTPASDGTTRTTDWARFGEEFEDEGLHRIPKAIDGGKILMVTSGEGEGRVIEAAMFTNRDPEDDVWDPGELPGNALGVGKLGVAIHRQGQGFLSEVVRPLVMEHAKKAGDEVIFGDVIPALVKHMQGLGGETHGAVGFPSRLFPDKIVKVVKVTGKVE